MESKLGVAFSGGGIKSFSQYSFVQFLENEHVDIDVVAGTSMGAVVAALVAGKVSAQDIKTELLWLEAYVKRHRLISPSLNLLPFTKKRMTGGFVDGEPFEIALQELFERHGLRMMADLSLPCAFTSVDLRSGHLVVFLNDRDHFVPASPDWILVDDVSIAKAIRCSASYPLVFAACPFEALLCVDGGVRMNVPVELLNCYQATKTVALTASEQETFKEGNMISMVSRVFQLMGNSNEIQQIRNADIVVNYPLDSQYVFKIGQGETVIEMSAEMLNAQSAGLREEFIVKPEPKRGFIRSLFARRHHE